MQVGDYEIPEDLRYAEDHEWVRKINGTIEIGITDYAQKQLKDVVFIELPEPDTTIETKETFGAIESVKSVNDLFAPISGRVSEKNTELDEKPELVNQDPYGAGWIIRIEPSKFEEEWDALLSPADYAALIEELEKGE
ncbi:MAG: glycine cleavage system protein GcvH [Candidatus Heimdallarchaeota archaeon]